MGRIEERRRIEELLAAARRGSSGVLAFVGEPGIGKTALLDAAAASATDFRLLAVRGIESEASIPFASLLELTRPILGALGRIPAPQAVALESALALRPAQPAERFAVGAATLSLLAASAEDRPLLVVVDDAQWLDASSAEALRFAIRRLLADPIAVLLAARAGEPSFVDDSHLPVCALEGLGTEDAVSLLAGMRLGPDLAASAVRIAAGNPLALIELGRGVDLVGLAAGSGAVVPAPAAISRVFLRRIDGLDPDARRALVLAAAHDEGDASTLERAAAHLGVELAAFARAEAAGVILAREGRIEFRHPLARSAVYGAAPALVRREAHRALAAVLSDRDVDRRAWHLASAATGTDPSASAALRQAADRAQRRSAYAVAAAAYERAARLAPGKRDRGALMWDAAGSAWLAGLPDKARELLGAARALAPEASRMAEVAHLEGQIALHRGPVMEAYDVLTAAASSAAPEQAAELLADAALACFYAAKPAEMLAAATQAEGRLTGQAGRRGRYLAAMAKGMALILGGDAQRGAASIRSVAGLVESEESPEDPRWTTWLVMGQMWLREGTAARVLVDQALEAARSRAAAGALPFLLVHLARDQAGGDAWTSATACYDESIRVSRETGQDTELAMALAGLAWLEARQGREDDCRAHAAEAEARCRQLGLGLFEIWVLAALGELELGLGHAADAVTQFRRQLDLLGARGITDPDISPVPELVEASLRVGDVDSARQLALAFATAATQKGQSWSLARASRALAMVADDQACWRRFEQALLLHRDTPDSFEEARTQLVYGARLRRARRRVDAREPLRAALGTFERLGARPWAEAARVELSATGETIRSRAGGALERLTPQELQIALLLAGGRTTKEAAAALFVSPKTVEYHLRHVYQKLGVGSRDALGAALDKLGASPARSSRR